MRVWHGTVVYFLNLDPVLVPVVPWRAVCVPVCDSVREAVERHIEKNADNWKECRFVSMGDAYFGDRESC